MRSRHLLWRGHHLQLPVPKLAGVDQSGEPNDVRPCERLHLLEFRSQVVEVAEGRRDGASIGAKRLGLASPLVAHEGAGAEPSRAAPGAPRAARSPAPSAASPKRRSRSRTAAICCSIARTSAAASAAVGAALSGPGEVVVSALDFEFGVEGALRGRSCPSRPGPRPNVERFWSIREMADCSSARRSAGTSDTRAVAMVCSIACERLGSGRSGIDGGSTVATRLKSNDCTPVDSRRSDTTAFEQRVEIAHLARLVAHMLDRPASEHATSALGQFEFASRLLGQGDLVQRFGDLARELRVVLFRARGHVPCVTGRLEVAKRRLPIHHGDRQAHQLQVLAPGTADRHREEHAVADAHRLAVRDEGRTVVQNHAVGRASVWQAWSERLRERDSPRPAAAPAHRDESRDLVACVPSVRSRPPGVNCDGWCTTPPSASAGAPACEARVRVTTVAAMSQFCTLDAPRNGDAKAAWQAPVEILCTEREFPVE